MTNTTRTARPDWDQDYLPTREECGEIVFQQIRTLMEDGNSQVLSREHATDILRYADKLLRNL